MNKFSFLVLLSIVIFSIYHSTNGNESLSPTLSQPDSNGLPSSVPLSLRSRVHFSDSEPDGYLSPAIRAELAAQHGTRAEQLGKSFRDLIRDELGVQFMQQKVETAYGHSQTTLSGASLLDHLVQRVTTKFDRHVNSLGQLKAGLPMAYVFKYLNTGINPDVEGTRSRRTQAAESDSTSRTRSESDTSQLKMQLESPLSPSDAESGSTYPPPPLDCCVLNSSTSTVLRCVHV
jgi:hypothetical protein